jgi:hypothetical protein
VDVYFLMDETGSMGGTIASVQAAAASILAQTAGLGDVAFAVGGYQDVGDTFVYRSLTDITTSTSQTQTAINSWGAFDGGDWPEANLFALQEAASTTSWRAGSERILVWFGDASGHDPSAGGATETSATAALVAQGIAVQAVSVGYNQLDAYGQATRIASATGGAFFSGIDTSTLVDTINDAITNAVSTYTNVGLDLSAVPAGVTVSAVPSSATGSFDRSVDRTFDFAVTFTGVTEGSYDFDIYGTVDGGRVAMESDSITVNGTKPPSVPDGGSSIALLGGVLAAMGAAKRRFRS